MNSRQKRIHLMKTNFIENLNGLTVSEYFQIPHIKITFTFSEKDEIYFCKFYYENPQFIKLDIPFELNCIVLSYLYETYTVNFSITIPQDYPFKPSLWKIEPSFSFNVPTNYKHAVIFQNNRYRNSWKRIY